MTRIQDTAGRADENSGYVRLFGNLGLGQLISRVHASVIRRGNELERILQDRTHDDLKSDLDQALVRPDDPVSRKRIVFSPRITLTDPEPKTVQGDVLIIDHGVSRAWVIEVKDGDTFDTKKADGELESMRTISRYIETELGYETSYHFCSFNQNNKQAIVDGAKRRFGLQQAMTGAELCELLEISYEEILRDRRSLQAENLRYFVSELLKISEVRAIIEQMLHGGKESTSE